MLQRSSVLVEATFVPSRFIQEGFPRFPVEYKRMVGISSPLGSVACKNDGARQLEVATIAMTQEMATRHTAFLDRWFVKRDPEADGDIDEGEDYACHSYAMEMRTGEEWLLGEATAETGKLATCGTRLEDIEQPLPFGTHAIIVDADDGNLLHSSIAIGLAPDGTSNSVCRPMDHLQVMDWGGNIGIASLSEMVAFYERLRIVSQVFIAES